MSSTTPNEQPKSTLSILSDKIDRLESMFLEAFTNPDLKPTANSQSEFLYAGNGKFNSFDELQESVEKKLSYLLRTTDDLTKRMESLISNLSNLENKTISYRLHEQRPAVIMGPSGPVMTPAPLRETIPLNPHMFAKGHRYEYMPPAQHQRHPGGFLHPQMIRPVLSRVSEDCLTFSEFVNYLHSPEVDVEGMLDPHIVVSLDDIGRICLNYNPHNLPQEKLAFKHQLTTWMVNSYYANCCVYPNQQSRENTFVVLKNSDENGENILVKDVETFINWIIDNELKLKKAS